jgi:hypothetical protein
MSQLNEETCDNEGTMESPPPSTEKEGLAVQAWEKFRDENPPKGQAALYYADNREYFIAGFLEALKSPPPSTEREKAIRATLLYTIGAIDDKKHTAASRREWKRIVENALAMMDVPSKAPPASTPMGEVMDNYPFEAKAHEAAHEAFPDPIARPCCYAIAGQTSEEKSRFDFRRGALWAWTKARSLSVGDVTQNSKPEAGDET